MRTSSKIVLLEIKKAYCFLIKMSLQGALKSPWVQFFYSGHWLMHLICFQNPAFVMSYAEHVRKVSKE